MEKNFLVRPQDIYHLQDMKFQHNSSVFESFGDLQGSLKSQCCFEFVILIQYLVPLSRVYRHLLHQSMHPRQHSLWKLSVLNVSCQQEISSNPSKLTFLLWTLLIPCSILFYRYWGHYICLSFRYWTIVRSGAFACLSKVCNLSSGKQTPSWPAVDLSTRSFNPPFSNFECATPAIAHSRNSGPLTGWLLSCCDRTDVSKKEER